MIRSIARKDVLAVILLFVLAIVVYFPVLVPGRVLLPTDLVLITPPWSHESKSLDPMFTHVLRRTWDPLFQFYPARQFLGSSLDNGNIPLWNPHAFSGTPFAGDGQSAVFYPINWLFALKPISAVFGLVAFIHTVLTGIFFYLYCRRIGSSIVGSYAGAAVWMLCGVQIGWQMWQVVDSTLCWLPLCLYFWESLRKSPTSLNGIGLSVAIGMVLLAGHLQFAFYVLLIVTTYGLYRPIPKLNWIASAARLAGWTLLGCIISSVQILATEDFLRQSIRISTPLAKLMPTSLAPSQLGLLVMPAIFGSERDYLNHPFLAGDYYEKVVYCGVSAVVFAAYALRLKRPGDLSRYWVGLCVFALLMGCGSPLYSLFYYGVPLFKSFHGLSRALMMLDFAVAALTAAGITVFETDDRKTRSSVSKIVCGVVALATLAAYRVGVLNNGKDIALFLTHMWLGYGALQVLIALGTIAFATAILFFARPNQSWLAALLVLLDMLFFAVGMNPGGDSNLLYPPTPETAFLTQQMEASPLDRVLCLGNGDSATPQSRITPNGAMSLGWNDSSGSDPLILTLYNNAIDRINTVDTGLPEPAGQGMIAQAGDSLLNDLNVRWIVTPSVLDLDDYRLADSGSVKIYENTKAMGAAWLIPINYVSFNMSRTEASYSAASDQDVAKVTDISSPGPGKLVLQTSSLSSSLLTISQCWCSGWYATVDARSSKVIEVNKLFDGLSLPPGQHSINLFYSPVSVRVGLYVSMVGWLLIFMLLLRKTSFVKQPTRESCEVCR